LLHFNLKLSSANYKYQATMLHFLACNVYFK
jgi:hypothetical protein